MRGAPRHPPSVANGSAANLWYGGRVRARGFAELTYLESARLVFARVSEKAAFDVTLDHPEAWIVDDRRISFAIEADLTEAEVEAHQRLLEDLAREAANGEAYLDVTGFERWSLHVGQQVSGAPHGRSSGATAVVSDTDITPIRQLKRP